MYYFTSRNKVFLTEGDQDTEIAEEEPVGYKLDQLDFCMDINKLRNIKSNKTRNNRKLNALKQNTTYFK